MEILDPMKALSDEGLQNDSLLTAPDLDKIKKAMVKFARNYAHHFVNSPIADFEKFESTNYKTLTCKPEENG